MHLLSRATFCLVALITGAAGAEPMMKDVEATGRDLLEAVRQAQSLGEQRGVSVALQGGGQECAIQATVREASRKNTIWVEIPAPAGGWNLSSSAQVEAEITNHGSAPKSLSLWVAGHRGWDAVSDTALLQPNESRTFVCPLNGTFPDGTPKVDPHDIHEIRVIGHGGDPGAVFTISQLRATGHSQGWKAPVGRIEVPDMETGVPAAGHRVRYQLAGDEKTGIYCVLWLPRDWKPGGHWPVIAEYPGNIFFSNATFSTGRPEQCVLGYGMTKGEGAIWVSLPFVDRKAGDIAEDGWGNADQTADYAVAVVEEICRRFGGMKDDVVLTGFSRGALACGYIGLRNDRIAALWKGIHQCQHYDGDGWNGAKLDDAVIRAKRFRGKAIFETDNSNDKIPRGGPKLQPVLAAMGAPVTFAVSHLRAHACAMFLDDRPSTLELRTWFQNLVHE